MWNLNDDNECDNSESFRKLIKLTIDNYNNNTNNKNYNNNYHKGQQQTNKTRNWTKISKQQSFANRKPGCCQVQNPPMLL